ncbi:pectin methylesterase-like acyl-CoA thioesterase [Vogesella perlucida]|nr:pectin methylesterase-like acyl-CoA thioesterase [Vogesella perlucida]
MKTKVKYTLCFALALLLTACASISPEQAIRTAQARYADSNLLYVEASSNELTNALMVAALGTSASTSSTALVTLLQRSNQKPVVVAGQSERVTAATIRRAISDAGTSLPIRGRLVIIGDANAFAEVVTTAQSRGLAVEVIAPSP